MFIAIFTTLLLALTCKADFDNIFNIPAPAGPALDYSGNVAWTVGTSQEINFITDIDDWTLSLVRVDPKDSNAVDSIKDITSDTSTGRISYKWTVDNYGSDLSESHVFLLWVNFGLDTNFNSHYFNISAATTTSLASTLATSTTSASLSATSTPATTTTGTASAATGNAAAAASSSSDSSNTGSKIGLGVGLGVGIPIVLAATAFGIWRFWAAKRTKQGPTIVASEPKYGMVPPGHGEEPMKQFGGSTGAHSGAVHEAPTNAAGSAGQLYEAPAEQPPMELPTEVYR